MKRALVLSEHDLPTMAERYRRGEAPSPLPYAVESLEADGYRLAGAPPVSSSPVGRKLREVWEHRTGYAVERVLRSAPRTAQADLVLALLEHQGQLPALLKSRGVPPWSRTPLVIWSCWLADDLQRADPATRRRIARRLASTELITYLSRHETEIFLDAGFAEEQLYPVTYGVNHRYYRPDPEVARDLQILAVGQDRGRDYRTLIEAVRGTEMTLDLVCRPENVAGVDLPDNVTMHGTVPLPTYRAMLRRAQVVAVPTVELTYPTGSSVALEASACGAAVAVTSTRSMRDYLVEDVGGVFVREGDVEGWRHTLDALLADPVRRDRLGRGARESIETRFNAEAMWHGVAETITARGLLD